MIAFAIFASFKFKNSVDTMSAIKGIKASLYPFSRNKEVFKNLNIRLSLRLSERLRI